jgi:hypothetical protein
MRFFCLFKPDPKNMAGPPNPERMAATGKLIEEMSKSGVLLATEGFMPSAKDVRVRLASGKFTVTDGPFTESKEVIGGFALIQAASREEVIAHTKRFLETVGGGESEIHELLAAPELPLEKVGR